MAASPPIRLTDEDIARLIAPKLDLTEAQALAVIGIIDNLRAFSIEVTFPPKPEPEPLKLPGKPQRSGEYRDYPPLAPFAPLRPGPDDLPLFPRPLRVWCGVPGRAFEEGV